MNPVCDEIIRPFACEADALAWLAQHDEPEPERKVEQDAYGSRTLYVARLTDYRAWAYQANAQARGKATWQLVAEIEPEEGEAR